MIKFARLFIPMVVALYATQTIAASTAPEIMVSIKPFYNICASVMQSVGKPKLLITQNSSPHDYQLKPSDARLIESADLVIWGGAELDSYLKKSINTLAKRNLDLSKINGLMLLPIRSSAHWEQDEHHHKHDDENHVHHDHALLTSDPHFWLDPENAIIIATAIALELGEIDPDNAKIYKQNATSFAKEINKDKKVWQRELAPYRKSPYIVTHDAYQYFNNFFGLDGVGSITLHPEIPPSAARIKQIYKLMQQEHVRCIFSEPQFNYKMIDTLTANTEIHKGQLDPLGQDKDIGPNGYFILINNLIDNFKQCNK